MTDGQPEGFGIYVHWPFCEAKCPYCDFNSHVVRSIDQTGWRNAYLTELSRYAREVPNRTVQSLFFGGGTPSLMAPETVASIVQTVRASWPVSNELEVTLEANPSSVEAKRFRAYAEAGVNRVSIGVQSLRDTDLKTLGRLHSSDDARSAIETAQEIFCRVSIDLIYARQNQSLENWEKELTEAIGFGTNHLSLYQLTIEQGTAFGDRFERGGLRGLPDEDLAVDLYEATQGICAGAGLAAYEVSNHAKDMAQSVHNRIYWRSGDWVGIGPGAHGRLTIGRTRYATETRLAPALWLKDVAAGSGEGVRTAMTSQERGEEILMMGLRLAEGVDIRRLEQFLDRPLSTANIDALVGDGLLHREGPRLRTTLSGRLLLNSVIRHLIVGP